MMDALLCEKVQMAAGGSFPDRLMRLLTRMADGPFYLIGGAIALISDYRSGLEFCVVTIAAFTLEIALQKLLKHWLKRERPATGNAKLDFLTAPPDKFSFPSGHTAGAFLFSEMLVSFFGIAAFPLYAVSSLVGLSRIYNGCHYPSDVIAGCVLGIASARLTLLIFGMG